MRTRSRSTPDSATTTGERPWLAASLGLTLFLLPTVVVLAGPLQSNGSPAKMLAYVMAGLVILTFLNGRVMFASDGMLHVGVAIVMLFALSRLFILARTFENGLDTLQDATVLRTVMTTVALVGVAIFLMTRVTTASARNFLLGAMLVGATYAALVGVIQGVSDLDLKYFLQPPGFVLKVEKGLAVRDGFTRVVGTSDHPIEFSVVVATMFPIAAHFFRFGSSRNVRLYSGISLVAMILAIPASVSRTAIVAVVASAVVYLFALKVREIFAAAILLGIAVLIYYVSVPELFDAIVKLFVGASEDDSITSRTDDYAYTGDLFRQNPILGSGFASTMPERTQYLDNVWLGTIISGGIVGVLGIMVIVLGGLVGATMAFRNVRTRAERDLVFALSGSFASLVVSTTVFDMFAFQQAAFLLFIVFALLWSLAYRTDDPVANSRSGETSAAGRRAMQGTMP